MLLLILSCYLKLSKMYKITKKIQVAPSFDSNNLQYKLCINEVDKIEFIHYITYITAIINKSELLI